MTDNTDILSIRNVYKVFGEQPDKAMQMLRDGADKDQIFEKPARPSVSSMPASQSKKVRFSSSWACPAPANPPWYVCLTG
ncbi:hypothetical protein [Aliamphritea spongicola]|nr:hypothetical protein [Aliamphritea spongicola]